MAQMLKREIFLPSLSSGESPPFRIESFLLCEMQLNQLPRPSEK